MILHPSCIGEVSPLQQEAFLTFFQINVHPIQLVIYYYVDNLDAEVRLSGFYFPKSFLVPYLPASSVLKEKFRR